MGNAGIGRVFLVDDNPDLRFLYRLAMERSGLEVEAINSTARAVEQLDGEYDAYVFDVMLPELDGLELTRRVRRSRPTVPIVVVSALAHQEEISKGYGAGASLYLTKPLSPSNLAHQVNALLDSSPVI